MPTEVLSSWDYAGHFVLGATCGELFGFCNRDTVAWLAGNISGGLFVVTDIRDAIGQLFQGEFVGAGLSILSVVPVAGDALSVVAKTVKFITRAASKAGDALKMVFRSDLPQWAKIRILDDIAGGAITRARSLGVTDDALERLGKAGVDFKLLDEAMAGASAVVKTGFVDWRSAEAILRSNFGGAAKGFKTIDGLKGTKGYRFVDAFDETLAIAREAKTGVARLTPFVREQIRKDVLLRSKEGWSRVEWHFFASSRSDTLGPTKELMDELRCERDRLGDTSPLMPPVDYSELSDEEAQRRFDELTSSSPERVAWLRQEVGDVLDLTPESLVPLWEWFVRREGARPIAAASCPPGTSRILPSSPRSGSRRRRCVTSTRSGSTWPRCSCTTSREPPGGSAGCRSACATRTRTGRS